MTADPAKAWHSRAEAFEAEAASLFASDRGEATRHRSSTTTRPAGSKPVVFIGHGRSPQWRVLKDFVKDRLGLAYEEFNREPSAGIPTASRLESMMDRADFAFLVMTAEDKHENGTTHARENVVHEAGLFQGRLGFRRAILLIESDCELFSNIDGLGQIRFPTGDIMAKSEEIRQVLEREGFL